MPFRPLIFLFHPCLPRLRRNAHVKTPWMRTELVAMQLGAYPESVNVSSPLHQWRRFVHTKASKMCKGTKSRPLPALGFRRTQARHLANRSERGRSLRSTTLLEIHPNADFVELGLSSSPPCAFQTAIALILAINRHGYRSQYAVCPLPLTMIPITRTMPDLPSPSSSPRHARAGSRHPMRPLLIRVRRHEHLWIASNSE